MFPWVDASDPSDDSDLSILLVLFILLSLSVCVIMQSRIRVNRERTMVKYLFSGLVLIAISLILLALFMEMP